MEDVLANHLLGIIVISVLAYLAKRYFDRLDAKLDHLETKVDESILNNQRNYFEIRERMSVIESKIYHVRYTDNHHALKLPSEVKP